MSIPTVVMAGGKGTRMGGVEKALARVGNKEILLRVMEAAAGAGFSEVVVASSRWTPATEEFCRKQGYTFLRSPGKGYVEDLAWLGNRFNRFVTVASDMPFLPPGEMRIFMAFAGRGMGSVTGLIRSDRVLEGMPCGPIWPGVLPDVGPCRIAGVNVVDIGERGEGAIYVFEDPLAGANINIPSDLEWANRHRLASL